MGFNSGFKGLNAYSGVAEVYESSGMSHHVDW